MPPPQKIKLIPKDIRAWLEDELKERGFSGYVKLTADLNAMLEARGLEMTIGKSAVHSYGAEYEAFARAQEQASEWAVGWMNENGLAEEAQRHNVLFQMVTTLAFKVMQSQMTKDGDEIDPKELHFIGRMLKDVMASSGIREKLTNDERKRVAEEAAVAAREEAAADITANAKQLGFTAETAEAIKARILGVTA